MEVYEDNIKLDFR